MRYLPMFAGLLLAGTAQAADLSIDQAWVRALPPTQTTTAGYLRIRNTGSEDRVLVGASSPVAGAAEIHTTAEVDGMMRMQRLPRVLVPAGSEVKLEPGGMHMMLFRVGRMPAPGEQVELCLQFEGLTEPSCSQADVLRQPPAKN